MEICYNLNYSTLQFQGKQRINQYRALNKLSKMSPHVQRYYFVIKMKVIEEKIMSPGGQEVTTKYIRGRFLGKVAFKSAKHFLLGGLC